MAFRCRHLASNLVAPALEPPIVANLGAPAPDRKKIGPSFTRLAWSIMKNLAPFVTIAVAVSSTLPVYAEGRKQALAMAPAAAYQSRLAPNAISDTYLPGTANSAPAPSLHFRKGMFLRKRGNKDAALIEFLKAVEENPHQTRAYYEQALIFKEKGYPKLAQSALEQALAVDPHCSDARMLLATIFFESGNLSHAASELGHMFGNAKPVRTSPLSATAPHAKEPQPESEPQFTLPPSPSTSDDLTVSEPDDAAVSEAKSASAVPVEDTSTSDPSGLPAATSPVTVRASGHGATELADEKKGWFGVSLDDMFGWLKGPEANASMPAARPSPEQLAREQFGTTAGAEPSEQPVAGWVNNLLAAGDPAGAVNQDQDQGQPPSGEAALTISRSDASALDALPIPLPTDPSQVQTATRLVREGFKFVSENQSEPGSYLASRSRTKSRKSHPRSYTVSVSTSVAPHVVPSGRHASAPLPNGISDDSFARRMRFLVANGTCTLKKGEAFMFSEETGEGVLFLQEGGSVRRKIAAAQDPLQVVQSRRPDVVSGDDVRYQLELLGRVMPPQNNQPAETETKARTREQVFGQSEGVTTWMRDILKL